VAEALASPLVRFVSGLLGGDIDGAQDVAQEALIAAWRRLPRLTDPATLRGWVFQVAYHQAMSWMRRRGPGGLRFKVLDAEPLVPEPGPDRTWNVLGQAISSEEMAPRLRSALASLPARYGAALILHHLEGLPARVCAEALGISIGTLKMRLLRARTLLRRRFLERERSKRDGKDAPESGRPAKRPAAAPTPRPKSRRGARPATPPAGRRLGLPAGSPAVDPSPLPLVPRAKTRVTRPVRAVASAHRARSPAPPGASVPVVRPAP
jgi:RNA polymerase sigma-70 factor (ECF subfamily)